MIDIGSGRGYLGCQLAFLHDLCVLGIDSSCTNTTSASGRTDRLASHWPGLVRNASLQTDTTMGKRAGKRKEGKERYASKTKPTHDRTNVSTTVTTINGDNGGSNFTSEVGISKTTPQTSDLVRHSEQRTTESDLTLRWDQNRHPDALKQSFVPITQYVTPDTDLEGLLHRHRPNTCDETQSGRLDGNHSKCETQAERDGSEPAGDFVKDSVPSPLLLTGLHTCGNLASSILRLFANNKSAVALCSVGCCYHHIGEQFAASPFTNQCKFMCTQTLKYMCTQNCKYMCKL